MKRYEFLEHTADLKFKAYGTTLAECFSNAACAMFEAMFADYTIKDGKHRQIVLEADDLQALLHDWLSELLFILYSENLVCGNFSVEIEGNKLKASFDCDDIDKHNFQSEVKAVTYHEMIIKEEAGLFSAQVICDT